MNHAALQIAIDPRDILVAELEQRKRRNPRYSLRAFALDLGIDVAQLSKILSGKTVLSLKAAQKIATTLELNEMEAAQLIEHAAEGVKRRNLNLAPSHKSDKTSEQQLDLDIYELISDMHHYRILEATLLDDFQSDSRWIARRLRMTVIDVEYAIVRLVRLGLLKRENGKLQKIDANITTSNKLFTTPALKKSQEQILRAAQRALALDPLETRSATGMTMAIDPSKIPAAKKMIQSFMEQLSAYLETGEKKEVYQLSINLFSAERNF